LLHKPALYLSDYFERNKTAYVDHLIAVRHGNHLREWLVFFLFGVQETARAAASVFRAIIDLKQGIEQDVLPRFGARRQDNAHTLMRHLYGQPVIDIKWAADTIGTSTRYRRRPGGRPGQPWRAC
jgi:Fic family protein